MTDRLDQDRGNVADYVLGTVEGWGAFEVVRWHGKEEISEPYEFDITLRRAADKGPVDLDALMDTGATFRIASAHRWRSVHGILAEAEEIDRTRRFFYYRVLLVPPLWRMHHRKRCRTFVYRTMKETLACVLENRAHPGAAPVAGLLPLSADIEPSPAHPDWHSFEEPHGRFTWRVSDDRRLANKDLHPFVVQYNESDFDFLTRWLAHEGIAYYFEHTGDAVVMVLTDCPGQLSAHETDHQATVRGGSALGAHKDQELVRWLRDARRMRSRAVTMRDYDFLRSTQIFDATIAVEAAPAGALGHFEFPAKDHRLSDKLAAFPAELRLQRFETERLLREGMSTVRTLLPGHTLKLNDGDGLRDDEEVLIVRSETFATQHTMNGSAIGYEPFGFEELDQEPGRFENRFHVLSSKVPFRPAPTCQKKKIWGVQVARVWGPDTEARVETDTSQTLDVRPVDIHCDEHGRVRVQFPWDTRMIADGQPSSDWCRVAQPWAGGGYGAVHIPRVGHEVLVAFEDGDPDRPIIVGSVYTHPGTPPPYDATDAKNKTRTTLKSRSTSVTEAEDGYNELRFTDYKGEEEVYLQAERDLNELVKHDHSTTVGGNQSNSVGGNQSNTVKGDRTHDITGHENVHVQGDRNTNFDCNETHTVSGQRDTSIGTNDLLKVRGFLSTEVGANEDRLVRGFRNTTVGASDGLKVTGDRNEEVGADHRFFAGGNHDFESTNLYVSEKGEVIIKAGSAMLSMKSGTITLSNGTGASLILSAGHIMAVAGGNIQMLSGGDTSMTAAKINGSAGEIHLNG